MEYRGFIWQASYRIIHHQPVVELFGRLTDGRSFLVRDDREMPHFFIRAADQGRATVCLTQFPKARISTSDKTNFADEPVLKVVVPTPPEVPAVRDKLHAEGIDTFEADVRFAVRYLFERKIRGGLEIVGTPHSGPQVDCIFDRPELSPADVSITPRILSFDIETNAAADRILAIAIACEQFEEVLVVDPTQRPLPANARGFLRQRDALAAFAERVKALDPDVLTGWNVIDFDLRVMEAVARRVSQPLILGRGSGRIRLRSAEGYFGSGSALIPGRLVLDGMDLVRGAFIRMDDYSLDTVARTVLGRGKALDGDAHHRVDEIHKRYREDLPGFVNYAITDAKLVLEILAQLQLVPLALARSQLTGMTPDRVAASIASFDFRYLEVLHKLHRVAPTVRVDDARVHKAQSGGHVYEPVAGLHEKVAVFDFKSLYPSIIRTFNIDPLRYVEPTGEPDGARIHLTGADFLREPGILPGLLDDLFPARERAKARGDDVASQAIKILMNSFYGVLGTPACRFHNPAIANAITGQGRHLLGWMKDWFEAKGFLVLYGDTDSLFISSPGQQPLDSDRCRGLAIQANRAISAYVNQRWQVVSKLELEFEKLYGRLFLPPRRGGGPGARKRYVGLTDQGLEFVGMEAVRRDWTSLAKNVQRELFERLFSNQPVTDFIRQTVTALRKGELDDQLIYHKGLRKRLEGYTANRPPHVAAALKSNQQPGRTIAYVITTGGAEPLDNRQHPLDREHYLEKQVRPVAEPVLALLGLEFDQVIGDDKQLGLF